MNIYFNYDLLIIWIIRDIDLILSQEFTYFAQHYTFFKLRSSRISDVIAVL